MEIIEVIQEEHRSIKVILKTLKKEMISLVMDQRVDRVLWSMTLAFIKESIIDYHHLKEREYFKTHKGISTYDNYAQMLYMITEYHEMIEIQYHKLLECWNLYQSGKTIARFKIMEQGEKLIHLLKSSMHLEETLFNLTRHECIVK